MRWRQCRETGEFIPIDEAARASAGSAIHGDIQSFVSPVDGSVISDRHQLREHNKRNNVVNAAEFDGQQKAPEGRTRQEVQRDRERINETINKLQTQRGH
jgi:hypothetical protein